MRVLITGSRGFVGRHVVRELENDHELLTPSREHLDLLSGHPDACGSAMSLLRSDLVNEKIDAIVHLAATCGGIGINKDNPGRFIYENLQMGINVLEAARLAGIPKVVNLGTVCSYPKHTPVPFQEEALWLGFPEETNAPYGIAKKTIIEMARSYHQQYGLEVTNFLPANMYGEWDNFDEYSSHVIPALIRKFEVQQAVLQEVLDGNVKCSMVDAQIPCVSLWGTGSASREFLYAGDCARAIAVALEKNTGPEPINLGTGQEITIKELAELIKRIGNYDADIVWDNSKPDGQPRRCLDITKARRILRWEPSVDLSHGLDRVIRWYRNEYYE